MNLTSSAPIARRDLLRGAAALVGGSALGLLPSLAEAVLAPAPVSLSLGVWDGHRFVPAEASSAGGRFDRVRLTVTSAEGGGFAALDAHAPCTGTGRHPFVFWVAPPAGLLRHRTVVATEKDGDLVFAVHARDGSVHELVVSGAALREGTYVLTPGKARWSAFQLDEEADLVRTEKNIPHIRIDVERA